MRWRVRTAAAARPAIALAAVRQLDTELRLAGKRVHALPHTHTHTHIHT
eukprot:COSAG03_NODE_1048_length_4952_cov_1.865444_1_plen_48_part_10